MLKTKLVAVMVSAAIAFAPVSATAQFRGGGLTGGSSSASGVLGFAGCVLSIMIAATDKGNKYKKELTTDEAITCGLLYWIREANKRR